MVARFDQSAHTSNRFGTECKLCKMSAPCENQVLHWTDLQVLADCDIPGLGKCQFDLISTLYCYGVVLLLVFAVALHSHDNKLQLRVPVFPRGM